MEHGNNVIEGVKIFITKLAAAKYAAIVEIENSDLYDNPIDEYYVGHYIGAPTRNFVRTSFLNDIAGGRESAKIRHASALSMVKELLNSPRDCFGFVTAGDELFERELNSSCCAAFQSVCYERLDDPLVNLVSTSKSPMELINWYCSDGDRKVLTTLFDKIDDENKDRFIQSARESLSVGLSGMGNCRLNSVFFEEMLRVFAFCRCAQLAGEDSVDICGVYLKAIVAVRSYATSIDESSYFEAALAYTLCSTFNISDLKCEILKKIIRDFGVLDHFMFARVFDVNDTDCKLISDIQQAFMSVFFAEDEPFLNLSSDDKQKISKIKGA